jgi:hypothetical protein
MGPTWNDHGAISWESDLPSTSRIPPPDISTLTVSPGENSPSGMSITTLRKHTIRKGASPDALPWMENREGTIVVESGSTVKSRRTDICGSTMAPSPGETVTSNVGMPIA